MAQCRIARPPRREIVEIMTGRVPDDIFRELARTSTAGTVQTCRLLDLLKAETLDERHVVKVVKEAKTLEDAAENARLAREARLADLGFEDPSDEQRKANLAVNVALREWPKD